MCSVVPRCFRSAPDFWRRIAADARIDVRFGARFAALSDGRCPGIPLLDFKFLTVDRVVYLYLALAADKAPAVDCRETPGLERQQRTSLVSYVSMSLFTRDRTPTRVGGRALRMFVGMAMGLIAASWSSSASMAGEWQLQPHIPIGIPLDEFENVSEVGVGLGVRATYEITDLVSARGDLAYLSYGERIEAIGADANVGTFGVQVSQQSYRAALGPQLSFSLGERFGSYVSAQGGMYFFRTNLSIVSSFDSVSDSRDNNFAFGWNTGVGLLYDAGFGPWIDVGLDYVTMYDLPGPAVADPNDPDGPPIEGEKITANELTVRVGVNFYLGRIEAE